MKHHRKLHIFSTSLTVSGEAWEFCLSENPKVFIISLSPGNIVVRAATSGKKRGRKLLVPIWQQLACYVIRTLDCLDDYHRAVSGGWFLDDSKLQISSPEMVDLDTRLLKEELTRIPDRCERGEDTEITRPMKYSKITEAQQLQDDCDVQATNIILHGLPPDVYALVNHQEAAKDIWDRVKMLMKGTELSYQERECRLYNLFDKFAYVQGETLYEYYWRFSQLINDMHTIGMTMQQVQVNTKFLNALPSEWSKFVTDVKLAKSLYTTNYDQLYAYLSQHERHANEVRITRERYPDPLAFVANSPTLYNPSQSPQHSGSLMYPPP
ncbi:hypothetical protein Tco_0674214 [Tanacetum coccineum]